MAWRSGSLSRSLFSAARVSLRQAAPSPVPRMRSSALHTPSRFQTRRLSFASPRYLIAAGSAYAECRRYIVVGDGGAPIFRK